MHLPFFSKVNLRHQSRRLQNMGFTVELAKIDA
ncbi:TIGR04141 family sporadically distributed protein [Vibrio diabolicus]|nr:TIGR04141 family sporadically distributed protein [Vibrio diabolicus]